MQKKKKQKHNYQIAFFLTLLPQEKAARVGVAINSPGIEEALKDVKAVTENTNYFFASVFTIAFF